MRASTVIMQLIPNVGVGSSALPDVRRSHGRPESSRLPFVASLTTAGSIWLSFLFVCADGSFSQVSSLCGIILGPSLPLAGRLPESINLGVPK